ncbi:MAG: hypothetical protein K6A74_10335 [Lachnospiraceae bacterium]|nr:hypothetical protein [Lachnospiraceae bacterium]
MKRTFLLVMIAGVLLFPACGAKEQPVSSTSEETVVETVSISEEKQEEHAESETSVEEISALEQFKLECREKWYETRDYPFRYGDEKWADWENVSFDDTREILNPPEDLLETFTMEELAHLFLNYPLFPYMPWYTDDQTDIFFSIYEEYNPIAAKFMESEERFEYLMKEYRANEFNYAAVEDGSWWLEDASVWADEIVICYVLAYGADFTDEERDLYCEIRDEKYEKYYSIIDDPNDDLSDYYVIFDEPLPHRKGFHR